MDQKRPARAILHIDGDAFFVSCEVASRPWLKGKPVVTGHERGIATALSYEAKARGVKRGMRPSDIRRICPDVVVLSSDYATYRIYAQRMYAIVRRYTPVVEEYSIDECFADITDARTPALPELADIARAIKRDLEAELGMTFSVGVGPTKVVAKIASKWNKPSGLTIISTEELPAYLSQLHIGKVWGLGPSTSAHLRSLGIATALDLVSRERHWVRGNLSKPVRDTYEELRGNLVHLVAPSSRETRRDYGSVSKTETFTPPSSDLSFIYSEISRHAEDACAKLRRHGLVARQVHFFIKTQDFSYIRDETVLVRATDMPQDVLAAIRPRFLKMFRPGLKYRASGVTLAGICLAEAATADLFSGAASADADEMRTIEPLGASLDKLARRHGSHAVFLASSLRSLQREGKARRRFNLPFLGEAR